MNFDETSKKKNIFFEPGNVHNFDGGKTRESLHYLSDLNLVINVIGGERFLLSPFTRL